MDCVPALLLNCLYPLQLQEKTIDLRDKLPKRDLSYYCVDELSECIADCRQTAGEHLRSEVLADPSVSILHE